MQIKKDLISVIVPIYNSQTYLRSCLDSIVNQTYKKLEIVLIDDGSKDYSSEICKEYVEKDDRVIYKYQENQGVNAARKEGLRISSGRYIGFVDSDDELDLDFMELLYTHICKTQADFVHSGYVIENDNDIKWNELNFKEENYRFQTIAEREAFLKRNIFKVDGNQQITFSIWSKLFKRELITKCYECVPNDLVLGEDGICLIYVLSECETLSTYRVAKYHYRIRKNSTSHFLNNQYILSHYHFFHELINACKYCGYDGMEDSLAMFCLRESNDLFRRMGMSIRQYSFPQIEILMGKKIIIYGAGVVGIDYYKQFQAQENISVVGVFDKNWEVNQQEELQIQNPNQIKELEYDYAIIAILSESAAEDIRAELMKQGVEPEKLIYQTPLNIWNCLQSKMMLNK